MNLICLYLIALVTTCTNYVPITSLNAHLPECVKSSLVAGYHLRIFSGVEIAKNPRALLFGEVGDTSASVNGDSDVVNDPEDGEGDPQDDMNADEKEEIKIEEGYDTQDASGVSIISWDMFTGLLLVFTLLLV